jgi:glycosyltransferase involved in cell wall biosynthesis
VEAWPSVSVVIPARNEERSVERAVRSHLASDYPRLEVLVVDDRSTDRTGEILESISRDVARLRIVTTSEPRSGWLGKPNALACGFEEAKSEWILFVDADVEYGSTVLRRAVSTALLEELGLIAILPQVVTRGFWEGVLMPNLVALLYLGPGFLFNSRWIRELALGGGSGNLVSRTALAATGGFAPLRDAVIDDIGLARQVKHAGFGVRAFTACDDVRVRMYEGFAEIAEGFTKNIAFLFRSPIRVLVFTFAFLALAWAPYVVLFAPAPRGAKLLAGLSILAVLVGRAVAALLTRTPVWSAIFHPLMVTVWAGIALRSVWRRVVLGKIIWRGRETAASRG